MSTPINQSYPYILRSTFQQTDQGLLWTPPAIRLRAVGGGPFRTIKDVVATGAQTNVANIQALINSDYLCREGLTIRDFELMNNTAGNAAVGIGWRMANRYWKAGQDTSADVYTDNTAAAQSLTNFAISADGAVQDGFVILSPVKFSWVSVNVTTAEVGAGSTHVVKYSNYAGTGWTTLSNSFTDQFTLTTTPYAGGATELVFEPPADWGKVVNIGTILAGYYALSVTTSGHAGGNTGGKIQGMEIGGMLVLSQLTTKGIYEEEVIDRGFGHKAAEADALVAYFSVANTENYVKAHVDPA